MNETDKIRLRHGLAAAPDDDGRFIYLFDQHRISPRQLRVTPDEFAWAQLINGQRTMREIHADAVLQSGGFLLPFEKIESLARQLDEALFLDNERFQNYLEGSEREPSCVGCYPAEPDEIREQFRELFIAPGGPGLPGEPGCRIESDGRIRAALVPHIDYGRGGVTYGWGFKEIFERTDASLFVIIGTSHYSRERFTLTRKNFKSPLGTVMTDQSYIDRLESYYGEGLFEDPVAHLPEHSIELEVVLFQYLYEGRRPFRIVPLLVGSFADCVAGQQDPGKSDDIQRMVDALKKAEKESGESICYIISGDLAHIGPKFDDPESVAEPFLSESLAQDQAIMRQAEKADVTQYFRTIAEEGDCRRICGLPPTWTTLTAAKPTSGKLLHYGRYVHPQGFESVSFASMVFE